ncbi:ATP-binding protein [Acuticoccus kandeliae]|uniref:ATP-binding protein n=1 Tax=Acuticoccus kandeliae TaxID=2073160 RepID=UPI00147271B2|nr:ATP-binding protein [Acuticoccus kandeliae]
MSVNWRRFVPGSVAGQFVLLLVGAMLVANVVAVLLLSQEQERLVREVRRGAQIDRIAALASVVAELPPNLRDGIAVAVSTPFTRVEVGTRAKVKATGEDSASMRLQSILEDSLALPAEEVRVAVEEVEPQRRRHWRSPGGLAVEVSVLLPDGEWLNVRQLRPDGPPHVARRGFLFTLLLSVLAVTAVAVWFTRRLTRPIRALGVAAERAGYGDREARAPMTGPAEVRRAAEAFNAMQERIAEFDADRARTIAAVGHDLRTPITSLRIRAEMLDDETRNAMVRTLDEMRVMADGLLSWGRSEAEKETTESVDFAELVRGLCDEDGDPVAYEGPPQFFIKGRKVALSRAIANVIGNARRYADRAVVTLRRDGGEAVLVVEDDGPGIPEESLDAVFEPFRRLDDSRSVDTGGAGLGLSIARTIINAHGGAIRLENRGDAKGLRVEIRMPLRARPGEA